MHYYPPCLAAFTQFSEADQTLEIQLARADLDERAARLLSDIADCERACWRSPAHATRVRRALRIVAAHLRGQQ